MIVVGLALAALAAVIVSYGGLLGVARMRVWRRSRRHVGVYRIEGREGSFGGLEAAREVAVAELRGERLANPARLLAQRDDGGWDVVDEVHVLS